MKRNSVTDKKYCFFLTTIFALICSIACLNVKAVQAVNHSTQNTVCDVSGKIIEVDFTSAYRMAFLKANEWDSNSKLYFATSTDTVTSTDINQGRDGKRQFWTFVFVIENPDTCFNVYVFNGIIAHTQVTMSAFNKELLLPIEKLKITSKEAVDIAINKCGLLPGESWAVGYHFTLKNFDNELVIVVVGLNESKEMTRIYINASTKEIIKLN